MSIELLHVPTVGMFCSAAMCLEVQADMQLLAGQIRPNPKEILNIKAKKCAQKDTKKKITDRCYVGIF